MKFRLPKPMPSQMVGIGIVMFFVVVDAVVMCTHKVPEHETYAWRQDSIAHARDSILHRKDSIKHRMDSIHHRYDSIGHRQDSLSAHYDSIRARHDSLREYWANFYDSVYTAKERKRQRYDSIQALPREVRKHYYDSVYGRNRNDNDNDNHSDSGKVHSSDSEGDSVRYIVRVKKDTILNLNSADTTELMYIRGIGKYTAQKIVRQRTALGGYYATEQLKEIGIADTIIAHFVADETEVKKLNVNRLKIEALVRHPYIRYEQAEKIYEHRRRRGDWKSLEAIEQAKIFDEETWKKVKWYLEL